jgi:hypothetical protein
MGVVCTRNLGRRLRPISTPSTDAIEAADPQSVFMSVDEHAGQKYKILSGSGIQNFKNTTSSRLDTD